MNQIVVKCVTDLGCILIASMNLIKILYFNMQSVVLYSHCI